MQKDLYRLNEKSGTKNVLKAFLTERTFRPIVTLRLCQATSKSVNPFSKVLHIFLRVFHRGVCNLAGMDLPWETSIADGFAITHGWGVVVAPGSKIGKNVTVFHGVTLGRRDRIGPTGDRDIGYPTIEDEVWIGPNAIIVGDVVIGKGSRIAGGSLVLDSVPPYSIVMGSPAKIVKSNCIPDVPNQVFD